MTSHEILGFMSAKLSSQILDDLYTDDRPLYRGALGAVANAKRMRPVFLEKQSRAQRHPDMVATLARPSLDEVTGTILRGWLLKKQTGLITGFLDALGIKHEKGVVESLPDDVDEAKLKSAIESLLAAHPPEVVAVYLLAFAAMNDVHWPALDALLKSDARLQLGA
ncbi:MAG: hypothetical protein HY301_10920 [Verrucomicrobia bacterium]|nr:hypothetical protein [Verrucomicrobiota bacterium]